MSTRDLIAEMTENVNKYGGENMTTYLMVQAIQKLSATEAELASLRLELDATRKQGETLTRPAVPEDADVDRVVNRLESSDPDFDDCSDAVTLLRKYKALCQEIKRGDSYHLGRIDAAVATLAAAPQPGAQPTDPHASCPAPVDEIEAAECEHMGCAHCKTGIYAEAQPTEAAQPVQYLQESDQQLLRRFIETAEDDESFDIGMPAVKRLADLGVVRNCGFGRYAVTMFGYWVHEHFWHQNPSLPLMTNADRNAAQKAKLAAQKGGA